MKIITNFKNYRMSKRNTAKLEEVKKVNLFYY